MPAQSTLSPLMIASPPPKRRRVEVNPWGVNEANVITLDSDSEDESSSVKEVTSEGSPSSTSLEVLFESDKGKSKKPDVPKSPVVAKLPAAAPASKASKKSSAALTKDESNLGNINRNIVLRKSGRFELKKKLGEGAYGLVFSAVDRHQKQFALKVSKTGFTDGHRREQKAFDLIQGKRHENLIELQTSDMLKKGEKGWSLKVLVLPLMGGSIYSIMKAATQKAMKMFHRNYKVFCQFPTPAIIAIGKQIADGMLHLEKLGVYHLDLKTENVLFCNGHFVLKGQSACPEIKMTSLAIKIADYGVCSFKKDEEMKKGPFKVQTSNYRAPEIFVGLPFNEKSDVWSFGAVLSELSTGKLLFFSNKEHPTKTPENTQLDMMQKLVRQYVPNSMWSEGERLRAKYRVPRPGRGYRYFSSSTRLTTLISDPRLLEFLQYILIVDHSKRPSFEELLTHSFFNN